MRSMCPGNGLLLPTRPLARRLARLRLDAPKPSQKAQIRRHFGGERLARSRSADGATQTPSRLGARPPPSPLSAVPFSFWGETCISQAPGQAAPTSHSGVWKLKEASRSRAA